MVTFRSRVDGWLAALMGLPVVSGLAVLASGVATGQRTLLLAGAGALAGYVLLLWLLVLPMAYVVDPSGIRVRAGAVIRVAIPWAELVSAELSSNPLSSPALSVRRIRITYRRARGGERDVLVSPTDREAFLRAIVDASPRHALVDGRVVQRQAP